MCFWQVQRTENQHAFRKYWELTGVIFCCLALSLGEPEELLDSEHVEDEAWRW